MRRSPVYGLSTWPPPPVFPGVSPAQARENMGRRGCAALACDRTVVRLRYARRATSSPTLRKMSVADRSFHSAVSHHDPPGGAPMAINDREKALETALAQIERQFGKGSVMRLGDEARAPIEVIPTGSISLDVVLGIGGLPRGRIVEIYGPESSGKTTIALHAVANAQRAGGIAAFIDAEHALDPEYAKKLGVDT